MLTFDPLYLFPPTASTSRTPLAVPTSSLALFGPLPTSSLLHLALNHLRDQDSKPTYTERLSEKAKGKRREMDDEDDFLDEEDDLPLPQRSKGKERRVLILTPDATVLRDELSKEGDVSLFGSRRSSETSRLLGLVDIRTLPTSAHLIYFLSTCYTPSTPAARDAHSAFLATTRPRSTVDPSYLPYEPTMVILHAPSDYLEEPANDGAGLEAYGSILAHFLSTFLSLTSLPPLLVLHDPLAAAHSLPTLPLHLRPKKPKKRTFQPEEAEGEEGEKEEEDDPERVPLRRIAERFFDWVGEAHEVPSERDYAAPTRTHYVLSLEVSPHLLSSSKLEQRKVELEYAVVEVGEDDAEGEEGGVRIEVVP